MGSLSRGRLAAAAVVVVLTGTYAAGHLVGRSDPTAPERGHSAAETATPAQPGATTDPPPGPVPADSAPPAPETTSDPAGESRRAGLAQPVTGPGNPPLPRSGSGPYGSRLTTGEPYVALTFDDGPDPQWTPAVLEQLREHDARATFCVVGELVVAYPELVREIVDDGHTLCNHTWDHDVGLGGRSRTTIRKDLERTNDAIHEAAPGARVSYYRQPGGAWTRRVVAVAEELGMSSLHWAVDPQDWRKPGAEAIASEVAAASEGAIVLLHDGGGQRRGTVHALRRILPELTGRHRVDALPPGVDPPRRHGLELPLNPGQR